MTVNSPKKKKIMQQDVAKNTMESKKGHIKNPSVNDLTSDEINLLSKGLNYNGASGAPYPYGKEKETHQ